MLKFDKEPKSDSSGAFIKLTDGQQIMGVLRGDVRDFYVKWENGKPTECNKDEMNAKFRFRVNFVVLDPKTGGMEPKVLEQGPKMYNDLKELSEEYDLSKTILKIKREGTELNTTYRVLPLQKQLEDKTIKSLEALTLLPLTDTEIENTVSKQDGIPAFDSGEPLPF